MENGTREQLSKGKIEEFIQYLSEKGRSAASLGDYRRILTGLYEYLPGGKYISAETGSAWYEWMKGQNLSSQTISMRISVWNTLLQYLGRREWQMTGFYDKSTDYIQPELTRKEYLRLLSAARQQDKRKAYLLIKAFGCAGMGAQELSQLTVEAVQKGEILLYRHNQKRQRVLRIPKAFQSELLDYIRSEGRQSGPVFVSQNGKPLARSVIYQCINSVGRAAQVAEEKITPGCLWKMHDETCEEIRSHIGLLAEQIYERMVDEEQYTVGWDR